MSKIVVPDGVVLMNPEATSAMPCSPKGFHIYKWVFMGTFERMEREEAAARLLFHSQELDTWVGVSWTRLIEMMEADFEAAQRLYRVREENSDERGRVARLTKWWWVKTLSTLGLYACFTKKPSAKLVPLPSIPHSGIFHAGPQFVASGLHELIERGLIRYEEGDEETGRHDLFFPTPALVTRILEVQQHSPSMA